MKKCRDEKWRENRNFDMAVKTLFFIEKAGESFYEPQISSFFRFYWKMANFIINFGYGFLE